MSRRRRAASLERMTRTSIPVDCNGKQYQFTPLSLKELALVERWAQQEPYRRMADKLDAMGIDKNSDSPIVDKLLAQAEEQSNDRVYRAQQLETMAGITYAILLCFRVRHPEMTEAELASIIEVVGFDFLKDLQEKTTSLTVDEAGNSAGVAATITQIQTGA